jgi:histidinol-phosphate aminotransferase
MPGPRDPPLAKRRLPDAAVNLSSNELHHAKLDDLLWAALGEIDAATVRCYPVAAVAIGEIGDRLGLAPSEFLLSPGSDVALRTICYGYQAAAGSRGSLILQDPNYPAWEEVAAKLGLATRRICSPEGDPNEQAQGLLAAARESRGSLIALSVPNGPLGWCIGADDLGMLTEIASDRDHLLVIDSCYQAFNGLFDEHLRRRGRNTVVVQSLSKSHGLAGSRAAIVAGSAARITRIVNPQIEQTVSGPTIVLAQAMVRQGPALSAIWEDITVARAEAVEALRAVGLVSLPSGGNFITFHVGRSDDARDVLCGMAASGFRVRDLSYLAGFEGWLRMTIGDRATTEGALDALQKVVGGR